MKTGAVMHNQLRLFLLVAAGGLAAAGCGQGDRPATPTTIPAPKVQEASWRDQLANLRAETTQRIIVQNARVSADQLANLADGCDMLEVLELDNVDTAAGSLDVIGRLPNLKRIKLCGPIDDDDLAQLAGAQRLAAVNLPQAEFTDRGLELLSGLPHLELLRFRSPHVTDAGLAHIASMPALRFLHLIDVPVTDAGLEHLHGLQGLESFYLDGGRCTETGLRALLTALPGLHLHIDQLHLRDDPHADDHADPDARLPDGN